MSDGTGTRAARSGPRDPVWTPPHNPVVLTGPISRLGDEEGEARLDAHQPYVVRLEGLEAEDAERLHREVGMVGGSASVEPDPDRDGKVLIVGLLPPGLEALRSRLLAAPARLLALSEELALAMRAWDRTGFRLRCGQRELVCGGRPLIMGVVNCTPDSFYAGSTATGQEAVRRAREMVAAGADLIDVGGESTRPGSEPVAEGEEIDRVQPVVRALSERVDVPISIDTTKAAVAEAALAAGASMVNDISGLAYDGELGPVAAEHGAAVVLMHMRGRPGDMYERAEYGNVVIDTIRELRKAVERALGAGIAAERLVVDPGIGFAKRAEHSLEILNGLSRFRSLGLPILVGPSRKSFIGSVLDLPPEERLEGTAASVAAAVLEGAHIFRVHDVGVMRRVADMAAAIRFEGEGWSF